MEKIIARCFYDNDFSCVPPQERIPLRADKLEDNPMISNEELSSLLQTTITDLGILIEALGHKLQPIRKEHRKEIIQQIHSDAKRIFSVISQRTEGNFDSQKKKF